MFSKVTVEVLLVTGIVLLATFFPFGFLSVTVNDKGTGKNFETTILLDELNHRVLYIH